MMPMVPGAIYTWIVIVTTVTVLSFFDVFIIAKYGPEASISDQIANAARSAPILALAFGILMGHFFAPIWMRESLSASIARVVRK
jgi:hypothetical protein